MKNRGHDKVKKWFQKFLKSIEEANKKNFGNGKMDCCDLNKQEKQKNNKKQTDKMGEIQ